MAGIGLSALGVGGIVGAGAGAGTAIVVSSVLGSVADLSDSMVALSVDSMAALEADSMAASAVGSTAAVVVIAKTKYKEENAVQICR